jgi:hypothetical protein
MKIDIVLHVHQLCFDGPLYHNVRVNLLLLLALSPDPACRRLPPICSDYLTELLFYIYYFLVDFTDHALLQL